MLADLGLVDEVIARWSRGAYVSVLGPAVGTLIAEFDHAVLARDTRYPFVVQCEQHKLANLVI